MLSKEEIESMKIGLWNIRADTLKTMQCSLADTSDKKEWQKEINVIDNALEYIDNLESDKQKLIEKLEKDIREETGYARWTNSYTKEISPAVTRMISKSKYAQEILSILKGENHE